MSIDTSQPFNIGPKTCGESELAGIVIACSSIDGRLIRLDLSDGTVTELNGDAISDESLPVNCSGSDPAVSAATVLPAEAQVTSTGATTSGLAQVSVVNVGPASGVWNGLPLLPGMSKTYTAYLDPVSLEFKRIGSMSYDATGTTFAISETP